MPRTGSWAAAGLVAGLAVLAGGWADPPPPVEQGGSTRPASSSEQEADRVLREKGLRPVGAVYALTWEDEIQALQARMTADVREIGQTATRLRQTEAAAGQFRVVLEVEYGRQQLLLDTARRIGMPPGPPPGMPRPPPPPPPPGPSMPPPPGGGPGMNLDAQYAAAGREIARLQPTLGQAQVEYYTLGSTLKSRRLEFERSRRVFAGLVDKARDRYRVLGADVQVRDALSALNHGSTARGYALGPLADYRAAAAKLAADVDLLKPHGLAPATVGKPGPGADAAVKTDLFLAEGFQHELSLALGRQQALRDEAAGRQKEVDRLTRKLADPSSPRATPADDVARKKVEAEAREDRDHLHRLTHQEAKGDAALRTAARDVAAHRQGFAESVDGLRIAVEASRRAHQEGGEDDPKPSQADPKRRPVRGPRANPLAQRQQESVRALGELVRVDRVPLELDRASRWVTATVNGEPGRKLVVDPDAEPVSVSERFARSVGLDPADGQPSDPVTLPGGEPVRALRFRLKTVQVGALGPVRDVDCLVLLDGYDAPPRLGAGFFEHFVVGMDADGAALTLTEVFVKPSAPTRGTSPVKARAKAGAARMIPGTDTSDPFKAFRNED